MRVKEHRGRTFEASSAVVSADKYRGVFDVGSTSDDVDDGVINEATPDTYPTREAAEDAAEAAALAWIDASADKAT